MVEINKKQKRLFFPILSFPELPCLVLCFPVQSCSALSCLVLNCPILSCLDLSCPVLPCPVLNCPILSYLYLFCPILSCTILSCLVLSYPELFHVQQWTSFGSMMKLWVSSSGYIKSHKLRTRHPSFSSSRYRDS